MNSHAVFTEPFDKFIFVFGLLDQHATWEMVCVSLQIPHQGFSYIQDWCVFFSIIHDIFI